jgi:thymidylate kinase
MIIIEGPDGAGKSTLVQYIRRELGRIVIKPYYPKVNQLSYYLHSGPLYNDYFLERYYLSEVVYPRFKKNREPMEDWKQFMIESALYQYAPVIFYLRPSRETILENIKVRGDDYVSIEEVDLMIEEYDKAIQRSHIPSIRYDFKSDNVDEKIGEALDLHRENYELTEYFHQFLSAGNCLKEEGIMFIGDEPSNKSVGEGFIRAFLSDKGSPALLHEILWKAGVYDTEMPYFTNWGKGFDNDHDRFVALNEEIKRLNPRKIICLGKEVAEKCGIGGGVIEHPSYVKRFSYNNYEWYINKIKGLVNEN